MGRDDPVAAFDQQIEALGSSFGWSNICGRPISLDVRPACFPDPGDIAIVKALFTQPLIAMPSSLDGHGWFSEGAVFTGRVPFAAGVDVLGGIILGRLAVVVRLLIRRRGLRRFRSLAGLLVAAAGQALRRFRRVRVARRRPHVRLVVIRKLRFPLRPGCLVTVGRLLYARRLIAGRVRLSR